MSITLVADEIFFEGRLKCGVAPDFYAFIIYTDRAEILGEALVEPSLSRRIVEVQQPNGKIMGHSAPRVFFKGVDGDEILIGSGKQKPGSFDRLTLMQGCQTVVRAVVLESEN